MSCANTVVDPLQEKPEPPAPPIPAPLDFTFDYGLTELKRSRLLADPGAVFLLSSFLPTDETVSIRRAELIVQATADLQPASSTERTKVSKTVIVPLIQDGPPLEGVSYLLDLTFLADLSSDPEDTSYLPWRHWVVAENNYDGGPPRFESAKVPFEQSESHPFVRLFRPEDESLSERVTVVIDKDGTT